MQYLFGRSSLTFQQSWKGSAATCEARGRHLSFWVSQTSASPEQPSALKSPRVPFLRNSYISFWKMSVDDITMKSAQNECFKISATCETIVIFGKVKISLGRELAMDVSQANCCDCLEFWCQRLARYQTSVVLYTAWREVQGSSHWYVLKLTFGLNSFWHL